MYPNVWEHCKYGVHMYNVSRWCVILVLAALAGFASSQDCVPCPQSCQCSPQSTAAGTPTPVSSCVVDCQQLSLTTLPPIDASLGTSVVHLIFSSNNISSIAANSFQAFPNLEFLTLESNQLTSLPAECLDSLTKLQILDLSNNLLTSLDVNIFQELTSLEEIYLQGNLLSHLADGLFAGRTSINKLNLNGNEISFLQDNIFTGLDNLEILDLSGNQLTTLSENTFTSLPQLNNVSLGNNPYLCDCNLLGLKHWISGFSGSIDAADITCDEPYYYNGQQVVQLTDQDFVCFSGYVYCEKTGNSSIVIFYDYQNNTVNFTQNVCNENCFYLGYPYAAVNDKLDCLCGHVQADHFSPTCGSSCSDPTLSVDCQRYVLQDGFAADAGIAFVNVVSSYDYQSPVSLTVSTAAPVEAYQWDFGDGSPLRNTSERSADHKYALPGVYTVLVTVFLREISDSLSQAVVVGSRILGSQSGIVLDCPQIAATHTQVNVVLHLIQGTDITINWLDPQNANNTIFSEHVGDVEMSKTGMCAFDHYPFQQLVESLPSSAAPNQTVVAVSPGMFFEHTGLLVGWEFISTGNLDNEELHLQVYTPVCPSGQILIPPGCLESCSPFAVCVDPANNPNCSSYDVTLCQTSPPRFYNGVQPTYDLKFDVVGYVTATEPSHFTLTLSVPLEISENDVLGMQYQNKPVDCPDTDETRYSVLTRTEATWLSVGDSLASFSSWVDNKDCYLHAIYAKPLDYFPVNPEFSSPNLSPGTFIFRAEVSNQHATLQQDCEIQFQNKIRGLTFIHPAFHPEKVSQLSVGTYYTTADTTVLFAVVITTGTDPSSEWTFVGPSLSEEVSQVDFASSCPAELINTVPECDPVTMPSTPSYAFYNKTYNQTGDYYVKVAVQNLINTRYVALDIGVQDYIEGLTVARAPALALAGYEQVFTANTTKGTSVTYSWSADNWQSVIAIDKNPQLRHTFWEPGNYTVLVNASNGLNMEVTSLEIFLQGMAPLANLSFLPAATLTSSRTEVQFQVQFQGDQYYNVTVSWNFGDGSSVFEEVLTPSTGPTTASASHVFNSPGNFSLNVTVFNRYDSISTHIAVEVVDAITAVDISSPAVVATDNRVNFEGVLSGSNSTALYNWTVVGFNTTAYHNVEQWQPVLWYTFTEVGLYRVTLQVSNPVSNAQTSKTVKVEEPITGLSVSYSTGPYQVEAVVEVTATVDSGSDIVYTFDTGTEDVFVMNSGKFYYVYLDTGDFPFLVQVNNSISHLESEFQVSVVETFSLNDLIIPECSVKDTEVNMSAVVSSNNYNQLSVTWDFGDGITTTLLDGGQEVSHVYTSDGPFTVTVQVEDGVYPAQQLSAVACVESVLTEADVSVQHDTVIAVASNAVFTVAVSGGIAHDVEWVINDEVLAPPLSESLIHAFSTVGEHAITALVFNRVSSINITVTIETEERVEGLVLSIEGLGQFSEDTAVAIYLQSGVQYSFNASVLSGTGVAFHWSFGVANTSGDLVGFTYQDIGGYEMLVTASNQVSSLTRTFPVLVLEPVAGLSISKVGRDFAVAKELATFMATATQGNNVSYSWQVCPPCDGTTATSTIVNTFTHNFTDSGHYTVAVTASNPLSQDTGETNVTVIGEIVGLTIYSDLKDEVYAIKDSSYPYNFTANVTSGIVSNNTWTVQKHGQRLYSTSDRNLAYAFNEIGSYKVEVTVANFIDEETEHITAEVIEEITNADLHSNNTGIIAVGEPVLYNVTYDTGSNLTFHWSFEAGQDLMTEESHIVYVYTNPGDRLIFVTCVNPVSAEGLYSVVQVEETITGISIVLSTDTGYYVPVNTVVNYTCVTETGSQIQYMWDFPGPYTYVTQTVPYNFSSLGVETVAVRADNRISHDQTVVNITVQQPIAGLSLQTDDDTVATGTEVLFVAEYTQGSDVVFVWSISEDPDFPIRTTNNTLKYTFTTAGLYFVNVTAENSLGGETDSLVMSVGEEISGLYIEDCCDSAYAKDEEITFTAGVATGTEVKYMWMIDGQPNSGQQIKHVFDDIGLHTIRLSAINLFGRENITETVMVEERITNLWIETSGIETMYVDYNVTFTLHMDSGSHVLYTIDYDVSGIELEHSTDNVFVHSYRRPKDYQVKAYANNSLGMASASVNITIKLLLCQAPTLTLIGSYWRQTQKSGDIYVEYDINLYWCIIYNTIYQWKVFNTSDCDSRHSLTPIDLPRTVNTAVPLLHLRPHTLDYGEYCLEFSAQFEDTPLASVDSLRLTVLASPLVAVISGGRIRTTSVQDTLILDASESYDPDLPNDEQTALAVEWICSRNEGQLRQDSADNTDGCFDDVRTDVIFEIEAGTLVAGFEYVFELRVSKHDRISGTSKQRVIVKEQSQPSVTISCRTCRFQPTVAISPSERVSMRGRCGNCLKTHVRYMWSVTRDDGEVLPLNMATTTTGGNSSNLVIRKGAVDSGHGYTFMLTVEDVSRSKFSEPGYAEMYLPYNNPPSGGSCVIEPQKLIALEDLLSFKCGNWTDDDNVDEPLYYSVLIHRAVDSSLESEAYMLYWGTQREYSVITPVGLEKYSYDINVNVLVEDKYGTRTIGFEGVVRVGLPEIKNVSMSQWLYERSIEELQFFRQTNDPQKVIAYSTALITVLNAESIKSNLTDIEYRIKTRRNVIEAVTEIKLSTVMLVRQISSTLIQSTGVYIEFIPTHTFEAINTTIENMVFVTEESLLSGDDPEEVPANSILTVISNVIDALNHYSLHVGDFQGYVDFEEIDRQEMILTLLKQANDLLTLLARSKVVHESAVLVVSPGISGLGQRSNRVTLNSALELDGCKVDVPLAFFNRTSPDDELLEVMICHQVNPYTWGISSDEHNITSQVQMLEYSYENGTAIVFKDMDNHFKFRMNKVVPSPRVAEFLLSDDYSSNSTYTCEPTDNMLYQNTEATPLQSALFSMVDLHEVVVPTSMHVQVRFTRLTDMEEPQTTSSVTVFLGKTEEPDQKNHYAALTIAEEDMEGDHRNYTFFIPPSEYDSSQEWYLTVTNNYKFNIINISVGVYFASCEYFNETVDDWAYNGCLPTEESQSSCVVCSCDHLTSFGSSSVSLDNVQFDGWRSNTDSSIMAVITVAVLIAIYAIAAIVARWRDRIDLCRVGVMPLCGKDGSFKYEITIKTGMKRGAGTSAHVGINIFGEDGRSGRRHLSKAGAFVRNSLDTFLIAADTHLGDIWKIRIWHDNTGLSPSWYLSRIMVHDLHTDKKYYFLCGQWLTLQSEDGVVKKDFLSADAAQLSKFSTIFAAELGRGFSERHMWFSMYERPLRSRFTRVQRVTCCFTLALLFLSLCALWYGQIKPQTQVLWITWVEAVVGLAAASVGFVVVLIIALMFKNRKYKVSLADYSNKPMTAQTVEMDALIEMSQTGDSMVAFEGQGYILPGTKSAFIKHCDSFRHLPHGETRAALEGFDDDDDDDDDNDDFMNSYQNNNVKKNDLGWPIPTKCKSPTLPELRPLEKGKWWSYESILSWPEELPPYEGSWRRTKSRTRVLSDPSEMRKRSAKLNGGSKHNGSPGDDVDDLINDIDDFSSKPRGSKQTKTVEVLSKDTFTPRAEPDLTHTKHHSDNRGGSAGSMKSHHHDDETVSTDGHYTAVSTTMSTIESSKPTTITAGRDCQWRERELSRTHLRSNTGTRRKHNRRKCYLPSCFVYINYCICFILCVGSFGVVVYYGSRFNTNQAAQWMVAVCLAFVSSIFILEPLKVFLIAVFRALLRKPLDDYDGDDIIEEQIVQNLHGPNHSIKPPAGYALIQAKEEARKISVMYSLLWQFVVWLLFFWLVLMLNYYDGSTVNQYGNTWRLNNSYAGTKYGPEYNESFYTIRTPEEFWSWSTTVMASVMHSVELDPFEADASYAYNLPIGVARLRQIRSVPVECDMRKTKLKDVDYHDTCKSGADVDTRSFNEGWVYNSSTNQTWLYSTEEQLDGMKTEGQVNSYSGGGYVQNLGYSYEETLDILQHLQDTNWLDRWTTAVFMEQTVYNSNKHLYSLIHLLVEFPPLSGGFPSSSIKTVNLTYYNGHITVIAVCMALLAFFMLVFIVREILNMRELGWSYLSSVWHWLDICIIGIGIAAISLYIYQQLYTAEVVHRYFTNPRDFTNFHRVMYHIDLVTCLCAILLFLVFLKLLRLLRFSRPMSIYLKTLSVAWKYIFCLMIFFIIILWAFAHQNYMIFGPIIWGLQTVGSSVVAMEGMIRGPAIDLDECIQYHPVLTPLIFMCFWIVFWVILCSLFAAVIINSYKDVRQQSSKPTMDMQDYEMIEFMMKRFKKMLGLSKVKQWRPKVKFRGLESLSSQSSRSTCSTRQSSRVSSASSSSGFQSLYMERWDPEQITDLLQSLSPAVEVILNKFEQVQEIGNEEESLVRKWTDIEKRKKEKAAAREAQQQQQQQQAAKKTETKARPGFRTNRQRRISVPDRPGSGGSGGASALAGRPKSEQCGRGKEKDKKKETKKTPPLAKKAW